MNSEHYDLEKLSQTNRIAAHSATTKHSLQEVIVSAY